MASRDLLVTLPLVLLVAFSFYPIKKTTVHEKEKERAHVYKLEDWINLTAVVSSPFLFLISLYLCPDKGVADFLMTAIQFYMFITHLSWSIGLGEPSYLHFPYVEGQTIGKKIMSLAIFADLFSFLIYLNYANYHKIPLEGWIFHLVYWNVVSHIGEFGLIRLDAKRFYLWVFGPDKNQLPLIVAWFKWFEGWIDSIGHLYCFSVACHLLFDRSEIAVCFAIGLPSLLFLGTLKTWNDFTLPAYLGLKPPGL